MDERQQRALAMADAHIEANLDKPLALADVAAAAHYSPFHLLRLMKAATGETLWARIRRLRLENGAMLIQSGLSVYQAAQASGYTTHEAFTRAFHRHFQVTPSRFTPRALYSVWTHTLSPRIVSFGPLSVWRRRVIGPYEALNDQGDAASRWPRHARRRFLFAWDDPALTPPNLLRSDVAWTGASADGATPFHLPMMLVALATHVGPPETLLASYHHLLYHCLPSLGATLSTVWAPFEERLSQGIRIHVPLRTQESP